MRDNWRKEMSDAARFDAARGRDVLVRPDDVAKLLCVPHTTWVIGSQAAARTWPWIADVRFAQVARHKDLAVWRFAGTASGHPGCLGGAASLPKATEAQ